MSVVLVIDYPSRAIPEGLARAGHVVIVKGGPADDDYGAWSVTGGTVVVGEKQTAPAHVDVVYAHRPPSEIASIAQLAKRLGATTVWLETKSPEARDAVERAGLRCVDDENIVDVLR